MILLRTLLLLLIVLVPLCVVLILLGTLLLLLIVLELLLLSVALPLEEGRVDVLIERLLTLLLLILGQRSLARYLLA